MDATNDMSRISKRKPRPMRSGTLDSLGGGNILRADSPETKEYNVRSLELLLNYQDNIPQNMVLIAREGKQKPSSSGTLDPIGGGNLVRIVDSDMEAGVYRSLESLLENQTVKTTPISTSDSERGFSCMNNIMTDARNSLLIEKASSFIFISRVGPPLKEYCPKPYVKSWLQSGRRLADETACRKPMSTENTKSGGSAFFQEGCPKEITPGLSKGINAILRSFEVMPAKAVANTS